MFVKAQIEICEMDSLFFSITRGNAKRYLSLGCLSLSSLDVFFVKIRSNTNDLGFICKPRTSLFLYPVTN